MLNEQKHPVTVPSRQKPFAKKVGVFFTHICEELFVIKSITEKYACLRKKKEWLNKKLWFNRTIALAYLTYILVQVLPVDRLIERFIGWTAMLYSVDPIDHNVLKHAPWSYYKYSSYVTEMLLCLQNEEQL